MESNIQLKSHNSLQQGWHRMLNNIMYKQFGYIQWFYAWKMILWFQIISSLENNAISHFLLKMLSKKWLNEQKKLFFLRIFHWYWNAACMCGCFMQNIVLWWWIKKKKWNKRGFQYIESRNNLSDVSMKCRFRCIKSYRDTEEVIASFHFIGIRNIYSL